MPQMIGDRARNVSGELISEPGKNAQKVAKNAPLIRIPAEEGYSVWAAA
jgi:hypothetical protein